MRHLDPERLAALGDSEPTAEEAAHLADCAFCDRERLAQAELLSLSLAERVAPLHAPLTRWETLSARLREEGILRPAAGAVSLVPADAARPVMRAGAIGSRHQRRVWLRAAAVVLLAGGGAAVGRATAAVPLPLSAERAALGGTPQPAGGSAPRASLTAGIADSAGAILSVNDALALMRRAESEYRLAAAYIAASDTSSIDGSDGVDRYRARLAALDRVSDAALAAVNEAPADPVVNQYLISTRAARAVTLQQLNSSLPPGMSLTSY
jgi:hypothetical protein